jgi:hypothetical protein
MGLLSWFLFLMSQYCHIANHLYLYAIVQWFETVFMNDIYINGKRNMIEDIHCKLWNNLNLNGHHTHFASLEKDNYLHISYRFLNHATLLFKWTEFIQTAWSCLMEMESPPDEVGGKHEEEKQLGAKLAVPGGCVHQTHLCEKRKWSMNVNVCSPASQIH